MSRLLRTTCAIALAIPLWSQDRVNRFDTPEGTQQGNALFQLHCSYCHGARGEGGRGADLTAGRYRRGGSDANLFDTIRNGIPGTEMPVVRASDDEVWKMVAFVKKLGAGEPSGTASGDAVAGKSVYQDKGGCTACHSIGSEGGTLGPDLGDVGRRRNPDYLLESLLKPEADVPAGYRAVRVITKAGETINGIRLNEDDVSIQLRDDKGNLRSFLKEKLGGLRYDQPSLMPPYGSVLSKKEVDDLVSYLSSLRGVQ
jgi:putative heme-binding domain-containing protein